MIAAFARRNRIAVRASRGVTQEAADALVQFGADNVFKFASLAVRFVICNSESVFEQALRQAVPPHHITRATLPAIGQLNLVVFPDVNEAKILHASQGAYGINSTRRANMLHVRAVTFLAADPDLLEQMIEMNPVVH